MKYSQILDPENEFKLVKINLFNVFKVQFLGVLRPNFCFAAVCLCMPRRTQHRHRIMQCLLPLLHSTSAFPTDELELR